MDFLELCQKIEIHGKSLIIDAMCDFSRIPMNLGLALIPSPSPKLGRREQERLETPSSSSIGRGGLGR
jgi:hypothetical protein